MVNRFNLVPADRLEAARRRTVVSRWMLTVGSYGAFLVVTFLVAQGVLLSNDHVVREELHRLVERVEYGEAQVQDVQTEIGTVRNRVSANEMIAGQPDWGALLALLGELLDEELVLSSCAIEHVGAGGGAIGPGGDRAAGISLELTGLGRSQQAVSHFVLRLEAQPLFDEVVLVNTKREPFEGRYSVGFIIRCDLAAAADDPEAASS